MDFLLKLITSIPFVGDFLGWILGAAGALIGGVFLYFAGKKTARQEGEIATQKETIDAYKDRATVEDDFRNATDDDRERVRDKWRRD